MATFVVVYFVCAVISFGLSVPSGLFIPSMMLGAAMGRLVGELLYKIAPGTVEPGLYALVGASAILGGITRMTISLTVIMVEVSNDINYLLPIMLALAVSKLVGDVFTVSIYDARIKSAKVPYLEAEASSTFESNFASSVMATDVAKLSSQSSVVDVMLALETEHNAFPIEDGPSFVGLITRGGLEVALSFMEGGMNNLDLTVEMDPSPFVVNENMTMRRVLRLFRGMGLRHLCVTDSKNRIVGIITRKDIIDAEF